MKSTTSGGGAIDAVVIGAGHNGLVAAALLADAGWDESFWRPTLNPAKSAELTPGFVSASAAPLRSAGISGWPRRRLNRAALSLTLR